MEFHKKLQELRRQKGLTQEELAKELFVSRTAISKWESGRGYPSIDSLKAIAKFFSLTVDELLSGEEVLDLCQADSKQTQAHILDIVFGLLDLGCILLLFLPLFGEAAAGGIRAVSLLQLTQIAPHTKGAYLAAAAISAAWGILLLVLQNCASALWLRCKRAVSLGLSLAALLLFILSSRPYAAALMLLFLAVKFLVTRRVSRP